MSRPVQITKEQMREGFLRGKTLIQEEWANSLEIKWVDELIAEGFAAISAPWNYSDNFQCERRRVSGVLASSGERQDG